MTSLSTMGKFEQQSNDSRLGMVFTWMYLKNCWRKWSLFVFSILFCIFSTRCWKTQRQPYVCDVWHLTSLLKLKESMLKIRVNLILQCFEVLLTCLWAMEKLMASAFNNLRLFVTLLYCPFVFFSPNKPGNCTNFSQQFIIVNQPSYPSLAGLTVDWLEYEFFVTSWDIWLPSP
jgi:hypothetical protein